MISHKTILGLFALTFAGSALSAGNIAKLQIFTPPLIEGAVITQQIQAPGLQVKITVSRGSFAYEVYKAKCTHCGKACTACDPHIHDMVLDRQDTIALKLNTESIEIEVWDTGSIFWSQKTSKQNTCDQPSFRDGEFPGKFSGEFPDDWF